MTVQQAREAARRWMTEEAGRIPGFRGAYTAGSSNWLFEDADLPAASDLDIMVVIEGGDQLDRRGKSVYRGVLLDVSHLPAHLFTSPEQLLADYHLAPSFATTKTVLDPHGHLAPLLSAVSRDYAKPSWVRRRCAHAEAKTLANLRSAAEQATLHDRVVACLFAAGVTTHVLLTAGLKNPTVRARYVDARDLLAAYGRAEFHETLLQLLGSARVTPDQATRHLAALTRIYNAVGPAIRTPFPFASDLGAAARPAAIDAAADLIARGLHREAMFWIAVTHSRCQKVLANHAPRSLAGSFHAGYQSLLADLGLATPAALRRRSREIGQCLPRVCEMADRIVAANPAIEAG